MVEPNRSIETPEEMNRITSDSERPLPSSDGFTGLTFKVIVNDDAKSADDRNCTVSKDNDMLYKVNNEKTTNLTIERVSASLFMQHNDIAKSEEQKKRHYQRRNSAIASMLFGMHAGESAMPTESTLQQEPRRRYQRRNSAVASMLFPSLAMKELQHADETTRSKNPRPESVSRRCSIPWSHSFESPSPSPPMMAPERKKQRTNMTDEGVTENNREC